MDRKFIIHSGPTNSGKTHDALEALKASKSGIYLAPLRLLAMEVQQSLMEDGCLCNLLTGEECITVENAKIQSSTVEMLNTSLAYDVAIIDEAQMLSDMRRGGAFTAAIMGVCANTIHVCCSPDAVAILCRIITDCGDTYTLREHNRNTELYIDRRKFSFPKNVESGYALVVFSKAKVIAVAAELQELKIPCSIIYGDLPYEVRKSEVHKFVSGETKVIVSTDAIGMGLNLPVKRVVFLELQKYDGYGRRPLNVSEVKQIGGRAGRFGMYDKGVVNAFDKEFVKSKLFGIDEEVNYAVIDFPKSRLQSGERISRSMKFWSQIPTEGYFVKKDLSREIELAKILEQKTKDKQLIYKFITIPFSENQEVLLNLWLQMFEAEVDGKNEDFLSYFSKRDVKVMTMQELEELHKIHDLIYNYKRVFEHGEGIDEVNKRRREISDQIITLLSSRGKFRKRKCPICGKKLPWSHPYKCCDDCYWSGR